jgi:hypothetical protein
MNKDPVALRFIDSLASKLPVWMTRSVGFRFIAAMIMLADAGVEMLFAGLFARYPGLGTATALPYIARSRGILRGVNESDTSFAARLLLWLDRWRIAGSMLAVAHAMQDYAANGAVVKVVNRAGVMLTLNTDGKTWSVNYTSGWNWDGTSNPERAGFWSECWVIIFNPPWAQFGGWPAGPSPLGALNMPAIDHDNIKAMLQQWKSAHTFIRCVILSYDPTLFDPTNTAKMPNGKFGQWSYPTSGNAAKVISDRYTAPFNACRYIEPELNPQNGYPQ